MKIDINGMSITLTDDQLAEIARQTSKPKSYKDIKSFEIACEYLGLNITNFNNKFINLTKGEIAFIKLKVIVKAMRSFTNWIPNWSDSNQRKWRIWFDLEKGFSYYRTHYGNTITYVPSALYVGTDAEAQYLGNNFLDLFKDYITEEL